MCVCEAKYEYLSFFFLLTVHILFRKIEEIGIGRDREKKKDKWEENKRAKYSKSAITIWKKFSNYATIPIQFDPITRDFIGIPSKLDKFERIQL